MSDYRVLNVPQNIVGIGEHIVEDVATDIVQGTVTDDGGHRRQFFLTLLWCQEWDPTYYLLLRQYRRGLLRYFTLTSPGWRMTTSFFR